MVLFAPFRAIEKKRYCKVSFRPGLQIQPRLATVRADAIDSGAIFERAHGEKCLFEAGDGVAHGIVQGARSVLRLGAKKEAGNGAGSGGFE